MQSLVNCIRERVACEPGWWRGQGPGVASGACAAPGAAPGPGRLGRRRKGGQSGCFELLPGKRK